ncbi:SDR family oxidoreductase [Branchiibius sp. NY16-3462-2]|uniref:SDR family oxidoreductase n=1 Tax=Branchiibius sp. NY16-3462-2 TaxID=1807500 RepID=UPI0007932B31|nr:SDR family oxidoreductase [Branchiibius sp. NY16-3462-2]KYH44862.1 3-hydroxy-2-methylbutyryl-CoA dehydrogenase [Branchiibius sp. NY16-3462-2]
MELQGTSAVVSGGASGLGAATARALAGKGAAVFALDLPASIQKAEKVQGVTLLEADVTNPEQVRQVIASAAEFAPLRTAVSCAGIGPPKRILNREGVADLDLFSRIININLIGTFTVLALAAEAISKTPELDHGQRGVIVNTASIAAFEGQIGQVAYASSKGGVVGMTLPAARDLAQFGIRVNTIAPGIIDTPLLASLGDEVRDSLAANVPFPHRLGQPEEYARLVTMIVEHDYLNGETIRMDGALRMAPR